MNKFADNWFVNIFYKIDRPTVNAKRKFGITLTMSASMISSTKRVMGKYEVKSYIYLSP